MSRAESTVNIQKLPRKSLQPVILDRTSLLAKETSCSSSLTLSQSPLHKWREVCVKLFRETHRERERPVSFVFLINPTNSRRHLTITLKTFGADRKPAGYHLLPDLIHVPFPHPLVLVMTDRI